MRCGEPVPAIGPGSSIPELIKFIKHSFRECEFDEVQNTLMEREKTMKIEMENITRDRDSLKNQVDILEKTRGYVELEKFNLEEKLGRSQRRVEELDKTIVQMKEKCEKLRSEKLDVEKKLVRSSKKCKEMEERLLKMGKEIEELRRENVYANKTIEELKAKEIEVDRVVQELKCKNEDAVRTIDELRDDRMKADKAAEFYESGLNDLDPRISKLETALAKMLSVNAEDLASLINGTNSFATAANDAEVDENVNFVEGGSNKSENGQVNSEAEDRGIISTPEVPATSGVRNLVLSGSESASDSAAESNATVQDNKGKEPEVRGPHASVMQSGGEVPTEKTVPSSSATRSDMQLGGELPTKKAVPSSSAAGNVVIVICDSDSDDETCIPDTSPVKTNKRDRTDSGEESLMKCTTRRKISTSITPSHCSSLEERADALQKPRTLDYLDSTDSDDELYSDAHMNNLLATLRSKAQSKKD